MYVLLFDEEWPKPGIPDGYVAIIGYPSDTTIETAPGRHLIGQRRPHFHRVCPILSIQLAKCTRFSCPLPDNGHKHTGSLTQQPTHAPSQVHVLSHRRRRPSIDMFWHTIKVITVGNGKETFIFCQGDAFGAFFMEMSKCHTRMAIPGTSYICGSSQFVD